MDLAQLEIELQRQIYKESYYEFFKDAFRILNPNDDYSDNWHIKYLCDELQEIALRVKKKQSSPYDLIINVPFRSSKSLICTVVFPVWCWTVKSDMKFICSSYGADLALEHAQLSRNLIESEWFKRHFSTTVQLKKDENAKGYYVNTRGGFRKSVGIGGAITGSGADILLIDDPLNPKKAASEVERKNCNDYYSNTLYSRLNQPEVGVRIIIMQRLHQNDLSGYLLKTRPEDHKHICIPAELSEDITPKELAKEYVDNLFWKTRFNKAILNSYLKALGSYGYSGQLQQRPTPTGGGIIKKEWLQIIKGQDVARNSQEHPICFYIDTAYTNKDENDPNAFLACFKKQNCLYILDVREAWLEFPELVEFTVKYTKLHGYDQNSKIKIEPKASGKSLVQSVKRATKLNVVEATTPTDSKVTRLHSVSPIVEGLRIYLIEGGWNQAFIEQVTNQPNSVRWDMTDVFTMAIEDQLINEDFDFLFL